MKKLYIILIAALLGVPDSLQRQARVPAGHRSAQSARPD